MSWQNGKSKNYKRQENGSEKDKKIIVEGAGEETLVDSGLEDTMVNAFHDVYGVTKQKVIIYNF